MSTRHALNSPDRMDNSSQLTGDSSQSISPSGSESSQDTGDKDQTLASGEGETAQAFDTTLLDRAETKSPATPSQPTEPTLAPDARAQLDKWRQRLLNDEEDLEGNQYTLDHPKMPPWVKRQLKNDPLFEPADTPRGAVKPDLKEQLKAELKAELQYENLLSQVPPMPIGKQREFAAKVQDLEQSGLNKVKALQTALELIHVTAQSYEQGLNRSLRALPPEGAPVVTRAPQGNKYASTAIETGQAYFGLSPDDFKEYGKLI